ncbi:MAG: TRAP transporter small permease [Candidatus Latescibacteria bacterium]|nr:TRAP transporter small permease [Candidatus Latescibacterota bacterium]
MPKSWSLILHRLEEALLVVLMGGMVLISFTQIALRNLCSYTLDWADPLVQQLLLWTALLGALVATRQHRHIHIDLLLRLAPAPLRLLLQTVGAGCSALVCGLLTWVGIQFLQGEAEAGTTGVFSLPTWKLQLILPLSFGLMAWRFACQAAHHLLALFRKARS